jgi:glutaredoxin
MDRFIITLYSRPGCHLCEDMKAIIAHVAAAMPGALYVDEIDISRNAELERRYGLEIPVLEIDGKKVAKYRISEEDLRRRLSARG